MASLVRDTILKIQINLTPFIAVDPTAILIICGYPGLKCFRDPDVKSFREPFIENNL